jgi:hypothetical protein
MARLSPRDLDALERAIIRRTRVAIVRHGMETVVLPVRLLSRPGGEALEAVHPSTGESRVYSIADLESLEVIA